MKKLFALLFLLLAIAFTARAQPQLVASVFTQTMSVHSSFREDGEHRMFKFRWLVANIGDRDAIGPVLPPGGGVVDHIAGIVIYDLAGNVLREENVAANVQWDFTSAFGAPRNFGNWPTTRQTGISAKAAAWGGVGLPFATFDLGTVNDLPPGYYTFEFKFDPMGLYGLTAFTEEWVYIGPRSVTLFEDLYF